MKIKIIQNVFGSANVHGNATREYKIDEIVDCKEDWQKNMAKSFLDGNFAIEVKVSEPDSKKVVVKEKKAPKVTKKKTSKKK